MEVLTNRENFTLDEIQHVEPQEYSDKYYPSKYGIIFKEKILISQADNTSLAFNVRLRKDGKEFDKIEGMRKLFRIQVLDQGKVVLNIEGINQITVSHILLRCN